MQIFLLHLTLKNCIFAVRAYVLFHNWTSYWKKRKGMYVLVIFIALSRQIVNND